MKKAVLIILFAFQVNAQDCFDIEDSGERLKCFDNMKPAKKVNKDSNNNPETDKDTDPLIVKAREAVKDRLKDPDSSQFKKETIVNNIDGTKTVCGEVNSKNGFGGYNGFSKYFISNNLLRLSTKDSPMDKNVWAMYCIQDVPRKKIGDWTQYNEGINSIFGIKGVDSSIYFRCDKLGQPDLYKAILGQELLGEPRYARLTINGRDSHWRIRDDHTYIFSMYGRSMKHIALMLVSSTLTIDGSTYSANGIKSVLQTFRSKCTRNWNRHIKKVLD